jgi:hypothetical protein
MENGMSISEDDLNSVKQTLKLQGTLIAVLFGLLIRTGTLDRDQIADELEKSIATGPDDQAAMLAMLQSSLSQQN